MPRPIFHHALSHGRQRRNRHHRHVRPPGQPLHHADADAQAGETAGAAAKRNRVQVGSPNAGLRQQGTHRRKDQFGVFHRRVLE